MGYGWEQATAQGFSRLSTALTAFLLAAMLLFSTANATETHDGVNGMWLIDVDATFLVNPSWREAYDACTDAEKKQLRANWGKKKLDIDLPANVLRVLTGSEITQQGAVLAARNEEGATIVHVRPDNTGKRKKTPPYDISMVVRADGKMQVVMAEASPIVFARDTQSD